jgi:hypothetical protein
VSCLGFGGRRGGTLVTTEEHNRRHALQSRAGCARVLRQRNGSEILVPFVPLYP